MTPGEALDRGVAELDLQLPPQARARMLQHLRLLEKWNRVYNLSAIRDPLEMVSHHLLDCLAVVPHLPPVPQGVLADVGSGAGFPGIPLALARPQWRVTLNDASQKKCAFLRQAVVELGVSNVGIHEGRVEQWKPQEQFDVVISRAFAELERFIDRCRHVVAAGGVLAAMLGARPIGDRCRVIELKVPGLGARRHLALCRPGP
jgi:16S rRNA (guanine527-N7)-methyltransferase